MAFQVWSNDGNIKSALEHPLLVTTQEPYPLY